MDDTTTRWWWVRHAKVPNPEGLIYGATDVACDVSNADAIRSLASTLPPDAVWVRSSLRRTRDTASAIAATGLTVPEPQVEPAFSEQSFGDWHGRSWSDFHAARDPAMRSFWEDPARNAPPGGESFEDLMTRVHPAIERLTASHSGREVVVVAHGGTIRCALALALGLVPERAMAFTIDELSLTRIDHIAGGTLKQGRGVWRVVFVNVPAAKLRLA